MPITLKNSPLIEIILELKWSFQQTFTNVTGFGGVSFPVFNPPIEDGFFQALGNELFKIGFPISERLVPQGISVNPHQVTHRYRSPNYPSVVFQAGPGVFTVNATPPYRTWETLQPLITLGFSALCAAKATDQKNLTFIQIGLRYMNGFRAKHLNGLAAHNFMRDVLHIHVALPKVITDAQNHAAKAQESVNAEIPLSDDSRLILQVGEGIINGEAGLLFDLTVGTTDGTHVDADRVIDFTSRAHHMIHAIFNETTASIREVLEPEETA